MACRFLKCVALCMKQVFSRKIILLILLILCFAYLFCQQLLLQVSQVYSLGCQFPDLHPFDESIQKYFKQELPFKCRKVQPFVSYLDSEGYLRRNESSAANVGNCRYRTFDRSRAGSDRDFTFTQWAHLRKGDRIDLDSASNVEVECTRANSTTYYNLHARPPVDSLSDRLPQDEKHLSVLLFYHDSLSLSAFRRNLPQTHAFMQDVLGMQFFEGYTKVADNTAPNVFPAVTGLRYQSQQIDMPDELSPYIDYNVFYDRDTALYDRVPFIWNKFYKAGYATALIEDKPDMDLLHYHADGFANWPNFLTYYFFPYIFMRAETKKSLQAQVEKPLVKLSSKYCYGNTPFYTQNLDLLDRTLRTLVTREKRFFIYTFLTRQSHNDATRIQQADPHLLQWLANAHNDDLFNRTVLIMLSDHGLRVGSIRETLIGQFEERLPLFSIRFPSWFYRHHKHIERALQTNRKRLTSSFDVHETLLDILNRNFASGTPQQKRGLSLLRDIPPDRTCNHAGIPEHFCVCTRPVVLNLTEHSDEILPAVDAVIRKINRLLLVENGNCAVLKYTRILHAQLLSANQGVVEGKVQGTGWRQLRKDFAKWWRNDYKTSDLRLLRVSIMTAPGNATFESTVHHNLAENTFTIPNDISRLNMYGNQSYCVKHDGNRKFCFCK